MLKPIEERYLRELSTALDARLVALDHIEADENELPHEMHQIRGLLVATREKAGAMLQYHTG